MNRCDFCSSPAPLWHYPALSFVDRVGSRSIADWLACEQCHVLIEADDHDALARRSLTSAIGRVAADMIGRDAALEYCRDLHNRFRVARCGAPFRIAA